MALPASVLEKLGSVLVKAGVHVPKEGPLSGGLPLAVDALNAALPDGGLLRGGVVELAVAEPGALGTSLGLLCCRAVLEEARARGATTLPWCAFVDPSSTLYAPGVAESRGGSRALARRAPSARSAESCREQAGRVTGFRVGRHRHGGDARGSARRGARHVASRREAPRHGGRGD